MNSSGKNFIVRAEAEFNSRDGQKKRLNNHWSRSSAEMLVPSLQKEGPGLGGRVLSSHSPKEQSEDPYETSRIPTQPPALPPAEARQTTQEEQAHAGR